MLQANSERGTAMARPAPAIILVDTKGAFLPASVDHDLLRLGIAELLLLAGGAGADISGGPGSSQIDEATRTRLEAFAATAAGAEPTPATAATAIGSDHFVPGESHQLATPIGVGLTSAGFDLVDHDGHVRVRLSAQEFIAALSLAKPMVVEGAVQDQADRLGDWALDSSSFEVLVDRLIASGHVYTVSAKAAPATEGRMLREFRTAMGTRHHNVESVKTMLERHATAEHEREIRTGVTRTRVVPVNDEGAPLLSLGLLMSYAPVYEDGRLDDSYTFLPDWAGQTVRNLTPDTPPAIYLFSNYIWSHHWNSERSKDVKAANPHSLTIHGGPNTPKYDDDIQKFLHMNPSVDVAIHGEGEETFAHCLDVLQGCFDGDGAPDLSGLRDVPGLSFRLGDEIIHTGKRDRISDLDVVPSPFQNGLFERAGDDEIILMTIETNRGCPYGCTYCDWGSATLSRIRKFDLDRVLDEIEWCGRNKVKTIFGADANFGIFARDVEIARKVVEVNKTYGYPKVFETSYAKNTVKHLQQIVEILAGGGVISTGSISLQSVDPGTLDAIRRSNIRLDKYDELAVEFGKQDLPLVIELMMGLPGATMESFLGDIQQAVDREVKARVNPTEVLMNSPMNDPEYRAEHQIETLRPVNQDWSQPNETRRKALVVSSTSFSREEYDLMERYRQVFLLCENFGVLRQISRFVRQETGRREVDLYVALADAAAADRRKWPMLASTFDSVLGHMVPPASWRWFIDELREFLVEEFGVVQDASLETALAVQHALLPARDRSYPMALELQHDFAAWHQAMLDVKRSGMQADWGPDVAHLRTFGPAQFEVDDPQCISALGFGSPLVYDLESDWEMASPVGRPLRFRLDLHN